MSYEEYCFLKAALMTLWENYSELPLCNSLWDFSCMKNPVIAREAVFSLRLLNNLRHFYQNNECGLASPVILICQM